MAHREFSTVETLQRASNHLSSQALTNNALRNTRIARCAIRASHLRLPPLPGRTASAFWVPRIRPI